ncbi:MAG: hypothetical protein OEV65_13425, partial [Aquincola sp.]|nr:hypothetical protein [Aquincola sp.]
SVDRTQWSALHCDGAPARQAGLLQVTVAGGTERDHRFTCAAAKRALGFFLGHGLVPTSRLRIEFREAVFLDLAGCMGAAGVDPAPCDTAVTAGAVNAGRAPGESSHAERVVGAFHPGSETALVTTEASPWLRTYTYFGLAMNEEMFMSVLTHEITHALSKSLYSPAARAADLDIHVQEEYVAYVAQLSTMSRDLRSAVLARFPAGTHRFKDETDINALSLGLSPEPFGVMSYRHFISDAGGLGFLHRIYCGEYRPPFQVLY